MDKDLSSSENAMHSKNIALAELTKSSNQPLISIPSAESGEIIIN